tara:strand:+ start:466 stop:753 length:288 start_codon:yes stop_codon:yes gene_type:complete
MPSAFGLTVRRVALCLGWLVGAKRKQALARDVPSKGCEDRSYGERFRVLWGCNLEPVEGVAGDIAAKIADYAANILAVIGRLCVEWGVFCAFHCS